MKGKIKAIVRPRVMIMFALGIVIGGLLIAAGDADDSPGLGGIGLVIAVLLFMRGIYHTGLLKKGTHIPLILMFFGILFIIFPFVLAADGEISLLSLYTLESELAGIFMAVVAVIKIRRSKD